MISTIYPFTVSKFKHNVRAFLESKKLFKDLLESQDFILSMPENQPISIKLMGRQIAAIGKPTMQIWTYKVFACTRDGKFIVRQVQQNWDKLTTQKLKKMGLDELSNRDKARHWFQTGDPGAFRVKDGTLVLDEKLYKKYW